MFENIGNWLITIPLDNPWRAIVLVAIVIVFAFVLHMLWELGFMMGGRLHQLFIRFETEKTSRRQRSGQRELARSR